MMDTKRLNEAVLGKTPNWELAADRLYRVLDEIELMSDPAIKAPDGINRMKQINMFARDAVQSYIRTTQQEQK